MLLRNSGLDYNWCGENTYHAALNFYPIFIEAKVSGVSVQDML